MNIFKVHHEIIDGYKSYIDSFINIRNPIIRVRVAEELKSGKLWPEPLIQFNPAFKKGASVEELVNRGTLHKDLNDIFSGYSLYEHQVEAINLGSSNKDFVVTSGTGSGKSLTYLGTIFNYLLNHQSEQGVKAIIIYPMNALINSQHDEITKFKKGFEKRTGSKFPISYAQYTGQENEDQRREILDDLPDILLTNYMMLELILTRVNERNMRESIYSSLRYLVFDELHTYRGRQGSDVALLIRRIKALCENEISCIGTSATMVTGGSIKEQKGKVAEVATTFFGNSFQPDQIVIETLVSSLGEYSGGVSQSELKEVIAGGINIDGDYENLIGHRLSKWIEQKIALSRSEEGILVRNKPQTLSAIVEQLEEFTSLQKDVVQKALIDFLEWISKVNVWANQNEKQSILPFKLHQFISQTGSVYMTLDKDDGHKLITLQVGGKYISKDQDSQKKKPIFPIVFSRESGHEFICVIKNSENKKLEPREFSDWTVSEEEEIDGNSSGYLILGDEVWNESEDIYNLPDSWVRTDSSGNITSVIKKYRNKIPQPIYFNEFGDFLEENPNRAGFQKGWFMPYRLLFDPTAGTFFDSRTSEGTKLTKLGSEGRSTSTTILSFNILRELAKANYDLEKQKLLSFTDNRQDAALQSGHFNDFIETLHLRTGINLALENASKGYLEFVEIGNAVFEALKLPQKDYAISEAEFAGGRRENENALKDYLTYRVLGDLKRSWRVILPNLEQCGLLDIEYKYLKETITDDAFIQSHRLLEALDEGEREEFVYHTLDYFRKSYAIRSEEYLEDSAFDFKRKTIIQKLKEPWRFGEDEQIDRPSFMRYETVPRSFRGFTTSIGHLSAYGKYLKRLFKVKLDERLRVENYIEEIDSLLDLFKRVGWLNAIEANNSEGLRTNLYQLNVEHLLWVKADRSNAKRDPIRSHSYKESTKPINTFFKELYQIDFKTMKRLEAQDHTGQIGHEMRKSREEKFKEGELSALFCSPTMELGIDISSLDVVHMRNVPPSPANYAQRSGRAGRSGQAALIFTYCSAYSPHDKHYFKYSLEMVSGSVAPPFLDLANEEMLKTHLNALYLAELGLGQINRSIADLLDEYDTEKLAISEEVRAIMETTANQKLKSKLTNTFRRVIHDFRSSKLESELNNWFTDEWISRTIDQFPGAFDQSLNRWRVLYKAADKQLKDASSIINSRIYKITSREYKEAVKMQTQAKRQQAILENDSFIKSLSEFYPYRYFASEGFLPGYNFTRLPIRTYLQNRDVGEYISRPRFIALREFGPRNIIYHNGTKYSIDQLVLKERLETSSAKVCIQSGYFLEGPDFGRDTCPLTGTALDNDQTRKLFVDLIEMSETRGVQRDRISCNEEERASQGFNIETYFSVPGGLHTIQRAKVLSDGKPLLNLQFIPSAKLIQINTGWRRTQEDKFRIGTETGFWRSHSYEPKPDSTDELRSVQLFTWDHSDALYIQPIQSLGLDYNGVVTLMYALKRAIELEFQVESSEIGVAQMGDQDNPNIFIYENAEGSLGVLSQLLRGANVFNRLMDTAIEIWRFDDPNYNAPASYDDLLSYYNQRHHLILDRFLIEDKLKILRESEIEIVTKSGSGLSYEEHYQWLLRLSDKTSSTERNFLKFLKERGLRLPDGAQIRHDDLYVQPDFHYENKYWIFCDGTPHDDSEIKERDHKQRQALINKGEFPVVFYYKDNWDEVVRQWPNIFIKVK
jgi:superfamily II DNA/RNA helicase